jgi:hypothetical protein
MGKSNRMDRRGSSIWFFVALVAMLFCAYSLSVAFATGEDCGRRGLDREWKYIPPEWECTAPRGG